MGLRDQISDDLLECKKRYESAIEAYRNQEWDRAMVLFQESLELETFTPDKDGFISTNPSLVFLDRCKAMKENPPPDDWNGVFVMKSK
jgi:adenylate cyclase